MLKGRFGGWLSPCQYPTTEESGFKHNDLRPLGAPFLTWGLSSSENKPCSQKHPVSSSFNPSTKR